MPQSQAKPVLVIQPRRLGDLILTFPLLLKLLTQNPRRPVWVAGQPDFYTPLMPFAPNATFFPVAQLPGLGRQSYETVINLGNDSASALCAETCDASLKIGALQTKAGLFINGYWQLYREGLTQNNRHNPFHWADLFQLDLGCRNYLHSRPRPAGKGRIGLFTGASEAAKRPDVLFWSRLANSLASKGFKPMLLGGPAEAQTGTAIMAQGAKAMNFCGKTDLAQLAVLLKGLDLLITPDTGPMHLADWLSVPVLNLSMGNVSAAETGPLAPGQHILRPAISCAGCWQCDKPELLCRKAFLPAKVAKIAASLAAGDQPKRQPGLELLTAARDDLGLYRLEGQSALRQKLENFWQAAFLHLDSNKYETRLKMAGTSLLAHSPCLATRMRSTFGKLLAYLNRSSRRGQPLPDDFWRNQPWHSRLFAGNIHIGLQNSGFSKASFARALTKIDALQAVLAP